MNKSKIILASAALAVLIGVRAQAADFKIIANDSVSASAVSADELKGVFLLTKAAISGGDHVVPVLAKDGPTHEAFLKLYVGKTDSALETYYRGLVFTGKASMPKRAASDADVTAYVAKTKGAIGYVGADVNTDGVKVLEVK